MELCVASVRLRAFSVRLRAFSVRPCVALMRACSLSSVGPCALRLCVIFFDEGLAAAVCFTALRGARRALPAAFFVTAFPAGGAGGAGDDPGGEAAAAGFAGEAALRTRPMVFRNNKELRVKGKV